MFRGFTSLAAISTLSFMGWGGTVAAAPCDAALAQSLHDAGRRVASLQATKPGQARVSDADGAEYTAGTVRRLTAQVRLAERACDRSDGRQAADFLAEIDGALRPPRR